MTTRKPPDLIALYIKSCVIGFALAAVFTALLLGLDIMGLGGLVARSDMGVLAALVFWALNGIVFSGVQFGVALMLQDDDDGGPRGGRAASVFLAEPVPVRVDRRRPR